MTSVYFEFLRIFIRKCPFIFPHFNDGFVFDNFVTWPRCWSGSPLSISNKVYIVLPNLDPISEVTVFVVLDPPYQMLDGGKL